MGGGRGNLLGIHRENKGHWRKWAGWLQDPFTKVHDP